MVIQNFYAISAAKSAITLVLLQMEVTKKLISHLHFVIRLNKKM